MDLDKIFIGQGISGRHSFYNISPSADVFYTNCCSQVPQTAYQNILSCRGVGDISSTEKEDLSKSRSGKSM